MKLMTEDDLVRIYCTPPTTGASSSMVEGLRAIERIATQRALEAAAEVAETPVSGEQDDITMAAKDRVAAAIRATAKEVAP